MPSEENQLGLPTAPAGIEPYLMEIAEHLFSGHAALMVGAGFSNNAKPTHPEAPQFPNWSDLGEEFYAKLHGNKPNIPLIYQNVPKLAEEVEATFGRATLEQILSNAIPDSSHDPSSLHDRLLSLPWSDVFTTNYDTLLDRAASSVSFQNYSLVEENEDLVYSERPRIIKLHGSLSSKRPSVVTEEDYRGYPDKFAPFVNTVQQSLLENTLCLVGFSGEDPNFLQWVGWIRDNLGSTKRPKIYLIGLIQSSSTQAKLLEHRAILPVDLSSFPNVRGDHGVALAQFLDYLESYQDYLESYKGANSVDNWPSQSTNIAPDDRSTQSDLLDLLDIWKNDRLKYPGWVILPHDRRLHLWNSLDSWLSTPLQSNNFPPFADLEFAFELLWRLERCLCPIFDHQIDFFEEIAKRYLLIVETISSSESVSRRQEMKNRGLNEQSVCNMCMHILISIMRYFREENCSEKWTKIANLVASKLGNLSSNDRARFSYEKILKSLFDLDIPQLTQQVSNWSIDESLPFWRTKKAGLLAEIGRLDEAAKILEKSLVTVRRMLKLRPIESDYTLVSQESYIMFHLLSVKTAANFVSGKWLESQEFRIQYSKRWDILKQYKCDPWNELRIFGSALDRPHEEKPTVVERKDFDLGSTTKTTYPFGRPDERARLAYSFLIFCEEIGVAFRIPSYDIASKTAGIALTYVAGMNSYWAIVTLIRIGKDRVVDSIFDRLALSKMTRNYVDQLTAHLILSLRKALEADTDSQVGLTSPTLGEVLAGVVPEIVSRLCCKCSSESLISIGEFLVELYRIDSKRKFRGIRNLTRRLVAAWPRQQCDQLMRLLMQTLLPVKLHPTEENEFINPFQELLIVMQSRPDKAVTPAREGEHFEPSENYWICSRSDNSQERKWAIMALICLHQQKRLSDANMGKFSEVLWSQLDEDGFPKDSGLKRFAFLGLPHPDEVDPILLFRRYLQKRVFSDCANSRELGDLLASCDEIAGASEYLAWKENEYDDIVHHLARCWDIIRLKPLRMHRGRRSVFRDSSVSENRTKLDDLVHEIAIIMTQSQGVNLTPDSRERIRRLINEIEEYGSAEFDFLAVRLRASCLHLFPEFLATLFPKIRRTLVSDDRARIRNGLEAILAIIRNKNVQSPKDIERFFDIVNLPFEMMYWSPVQSVGLPNVLRCMVSILREDSGVMGKELEEKTLLILDRIAEQTCLSNDKIGVAERLEVRREAARLAFHLYSGYGSQDIGTSAVLKRWEMICRKEEEFAEIRNMWCVP